MPASRRGDQPPRSRLFANGARAGPHVVSQKCRTNKSHGGEVRVLGFDPQIDPRPVRQRIGLVPQETNLYADLNALDNLWHHAALYCRELRSVDGRIEQLLRLTDLWERRRGRVTTFSGGMKRRLALARALLHNPEIMFFHEPMLGVDVQGQHALLYRIQAQRQQGKTFVVSPNTMTEANVLFDRLAVIDHGRLIALDAPERLKKALGRDIVALRTAPAIADPHTLLSGLGVQDIARTGPG